MKLPHYSKAKIDNRKLKNYCLNPHHPLGKHKARVFKTVLGIEQEHADHLKNQILTALPDAVAEKRFEDKFGIRFLVRILVNHKNRQANVVTIWIIPKQQKVPRLVTCYINR